MAGMRYGALMTEPRFAPNTRDELQEAEYEFPYHWIPASQPAWAGTRRLEWGFEYLGTMEAVIDAVLSLGPRRVLDLGCGDGRLTCELADRGIREVVGVDLSSTAIGFARAFAANRARPPEFHCAELGDLESMPPFDVCVAMEVLEHIHDGEVPAVVRDVYEHLTPGGAFVVTVPTRTRPVHEKHYRHYDLDLLIGHLAPHFTLQRALYLHRVGRTATTIRRICHNRLFDLSHPGLLARLAVAYRDRVQYAAEADGAHLLAVFTGRQEPGA